MAFLGFIVYCYSVFVLRVGVYMATRGRPSFLNDRTSTTVSLEKEDLAQLHAEGADISAEFREWVRFRLSKNASPLEKKKVEAKALKDSIKEDVIKYKRLRSEIKMLEEKELEKNAKKIQLEELANEREVIFLTKFRKLIFSGAICEIDFYGKVRKELKFDDPSEAKKWLLEHYKIQRDGDRKFTEDRIKTFLRWDNDISRMW